MKREGGVSNMGHDIFRDERGVTTISMAIALFVTIALIFTGAQTYRVSSAAAEIQEVADACALAAESEVAEYVTAVQVCDAALLSMTLLGGTMYGLGVVAACVPPAAAVSEKLIELASKTMDLRDRAYDSMTEKLNAIQGLLPFLASANALGVARANNAGVLPAEYIAVAALVPASGDEVGSGLSPGLSEAGQAVEDAAADIRAKAQEADEAAKRAAEAKERAFLADCGREPGYCMSERARSLSHLADEDNPVYLNMDAWNLEVGLKRVCSYYAQRLSSWGLEGSNAEQRADAVLRKRFYQYAVAELSSAFIHDEEGSFDAYLPSLYRNTETMRTTPLYTEAVYPVTQMSTGMQMHAWSGCPNASGFGRLGSIAELDHGGFVTCPSCRFTVSSLGKVAAASTSIANGFEHHYHEFREAVESYRAERSAADPLSRSVKAAAQPLLDALGEALSDAVSKRLEARPPGRDGCVALVVNLNQNSADFGFENRFVTSGQTLGTRAAVSGAVVMADDTESGQSAISTIVGKLDPSGGLLGGAANIAGDVWTGLLRVYEDGQDALLDSVKTGLDSFPTQTVSGLGNWATEALSSTIEAMGLQPADIRSKKPALVNTARVVENDSGDFAVKYKEAKAEGLGTSTSTGLLSHAASQISGWVASTIFTTKIPICEVELPFAGGTYIIEWEIPSAIADKGNNAVEEALSSIAGTVESYAGIRVWE